MPSFKLYILLFAILSFSDSFAQSELTVYSEDSTQFQLKVNTALVTDSFSNRFELRFINAMRANLVILDSLNSILVEKNIELPPKVKRVYQLRSTSGGWRLMITSEFGLTQPVNQRNFLSDAIPTSESTVANDTLNTTLIITSVFKSAASPNLNDIAALDELKFESEKLRAINKLLSEKTLTRDELQSVLKKISFEDKRANLIEQYPIVFAGKLSSQNIDELFKLDRYRSQAMKALGL